MACFSFYAPLVAGRAGAQTPASDPATEQARVAYGEAEKAFALGHFEDALKGYERAYELKPLPAFLYNIGQCQKHLGHWERASYFFQGYLARETKVKNRPRVLALVEEMNEKQRAEDQAAAARAALAASTGTPGTVPGSGAPGGTAVATKTSTGEPGKTTLDPHVLEPPPTPAQPSQPLYKRWWVWTAAGVVVAGAAAAGIGGYSATHPTVSTEHLQGSLGMPIDVSH